MKRRFTSTERKSLLCLLLSGAIMVVWGSLIAIHSDAGGWDFKAIFYGTHSLMRHSDPYNPAAMQQTYESEGGRCPSNPDGENLCRQAVFVCVNLPTALFLIAPLALLPWKAAWLLWLSSIAASFMLASLIMWAVAKNQAPKVSILLICLMLCDAEIVFELGNLAGIAVSFCVIAVWCFLEDRFVPAGILCLAISLLLKPHDAALVWLYFVLAGGVYRRRAFQAMGVAVALALPALLWVSHVSPQWWQELHAHIAAPHGSLNDPGPRSLSFDSADYVISLQAVFSLFQDDPRFYNLASYLTCGALLCAGAARVIQSRFTKRNAWIALAAIAAFSMLPMYHRNHDAKLLLLAVPACAILWAEGGRLKWPAGAITTAAILATADVPSAALLVMMKSLNVSAAGLFNKMLIVFLLHPAPMVLLTMGVFYLWVFFRRTAQEKQESVARQIQPAMV